MQKKKDLKTLIPPKEKAASVSVYSGRAGKWRAEQSLDELNILAITAGADVLQQFLQEKSRKDPAYYCGKGKLEEIKAYCAGNNIDLILFDDPLTPAQMRNIETLLDRKVLDRTQLILDIFAMRARTAEGKLQVELAQIDYLLPRLTGQGIQLSRLGGGIGTRGPGETKLEFDRRRLRTRRSRLQKELQHVKKIRDLQRKSRTAIPLPTVAMVGYTNAGKTTLFNTVTNSNNLASPILFATLDPTIKSLRIPNHQSILISDTVGFIRKLPHELIAAFRATLEEVVQADLLLHVIDVANPDVDEQIEAVLGTIKDLEAGAIPVIHVLNKIDLIDDTSGIIRSYRHKLGNVVGISAEKKTGIDQLLLAIQEQLSQFYEKLNLSIPNSEQALISTIHDEGHVYHQKYVDGMVEIEVELPKRLAEKVRHYSN